MSAVTVHSDFGVQENKICHCFHFPFFSFYLPRSDGTRCHDFNFWMLTFKPAFSFLSITLIKRLFSSSSLSAIKCCHVLLDPSYSVSLALWPLTSCSGKHFIRLLAWLDLYLHFYLPTSSSLHTILSNIKLRFIG